jgi:hypothetical protein
MPFDFSQECKEYQIDEKFVREIDGKLFPLFEKATIINPIFNKFLSDRNKEVSRTTFGNFSNFEQLLDKIKKQLQLSPKEVAVLFMIDYLVAVESLLTYIVDTIVFAIVSTGKTLIDTRTQKSVILLEEIQLVPLGTKLNFLTANGFSMIAKRCSVRIRNSSAHLNYTVDKDGNILLPQGDLIKVFDDMNEHHAKLSDAAIGGFIALRHFYYEKYGSYQVQ